MKYKNTTPESDNRFDERQVLERGNAFRNAYIALAVAMLVCYFAKDCFEVNLVDDSSIMLGCLWVSAVAFAVTMIVKDAYDGIHEGKSSILVTIMGIVGCFMLVVEIIKAVRGTFVFYSTAGILVSAVGMLTICIIYWIKRKRDRKHDSTEEKS